MEEATTVLLLVFVLIVSGDAVNPGCECLIYSETYGKEVGIFSSPDYPKPYSSNIDCLLYSFIAGKNEIIEITFKDFDVHKTHLECETGHFVKVFLHVDRAEVDEHTPWSGLLCGGLADIPHVLYSSGPGLVLEFHTAPTPLPSNATGFIGNFRFIDRRMFKTEGAQLPGSVCDYMFRSGDLPASSGHFYSPRYPSSYPKNIRCAYTFQSRSKERIRVVFEEVTLQKGDITCLNRADVIKVHDGRAATAPVIREVCNEVAQVEVLSTGPHLYIEFVADSQWPGQGFNALYEFQPAINNTIDTGGLGQNGPSVSASASSASNCNYTLLDSSVAKSGTLISPGYPGPYPPRSSCLFDFQGRGKERVQITFTDFSLYHPTDDPKECDSVDAVMIYVLVDGRPEKSESFCGESIPMSVMSNGPKMRLQFQGLYSASHVRGFKATYVFIEDYGIRWGRQLPDYTCAFALSSNASLTGVVHSPNHPGHYPRDTECHYFFYGEHFQRVRLHFTLFDVEGMLPCEANSASDYIEFSDMMLRDDKYARSCGQLQPFFVQSESNFFRVTFRSNDRLDATGFNATYRFVPYDRSSVQLNHPAHTSHATYLDSRPLLVIVLVYFVR
ncbi:hypothetical protein LSTR_LSTR005537 [Laodelphax striatellus]|uniref:CUB domain-containing protein n=1 Tax=Laodelphax striatellus TaxID=195883 RepID=A0A482WY26_LAOST|nr:hypothetical protein LSTR_LSTR005537 [Laodelphax striatellus]